MYKKIAVMAARLFLVIGWIALLAPQATLTQAQSTTPVTPITPQIPGTSPQVPQDFPRPESTTPETDASLSGFSPQETTALLGLPALKAVIFVGPIDGNTGPGTLEQISYANRTATALRSYGVTVQEFYPNASKANWADIKAAAKGAHFIIYRGHGVAISGTNPLQVGGFWLKDGEYVSSDQIRSELRPAKNFIVMMYGSYTAGSTSGDTYSVGLDEAKRRVAMYSDPFFDIGAGAYYADWFGDAFDHYTHYLFSGQTHRNAYVTFYDFNNSLMWFGNHPDHPSQALWMGWDEWYDPKPQWNNVFIGQPDITLTQMFGSTSSRQLTRKFYIPIIDK